METTTATSAIQVPTTQSARAAQTATDRANAAFLDISIISESYRCQYPSKHCTNDRSVKRDGDLHKFCEFHRSKANRNQRKLEQKRKLEAKIPRKTASSPRYQRQQQRDSLSSRSSLSSRGSLRLSRTSLSSDIADLDDGSDHETPWDLLLPVDLADTDIQALASLVGATDSGAH